MSRKQPIRTYQRKTAKKPFVSSLTLSALPKEKYNSVENNHFDKNETYNDSLNYDPFETTFDRIAKGAVVPPMPSDINQNDSWKGNSSDSDINDATNVKSLEHMSDLFIRKNTSSSTNVSHKLAHKCRKQKRYEPEITISIGILPKRTRAMSIKNKPGKAQGQKRQVNKMQKKNMLKDKFKSSSIRRQRSHINSNVIDNSKDASYKNGISCDNNYERLHQNVLKIDKRITLQNKSIRLNNSITDFKHVANYQQIIKPCFVKLNVCAVQNYILNRKKIAENRQDVLHNTKFLYTDTSQTDKNISKIQNTISRSVSTEYNNFESFKHMSVKQCSVILYDIVKDWYILKSKKNMKDTINMRDKSNISHLVAHNPFEITPNCNKSFKLALYNTKKSNNLIKNSFVKVERLKIGEFVKQDGSVSNEREQNIISSTPIGKRVKPSSSLVIFSPINSNIYDKLHWSQEYSLVTEKEDISNINQKDSHSLTTMSKCYKFDSADIQKQQTQVLFQKSQMSTDSTIENEMTSCKDNIHVITQKYETEFNVETRIPYSLNMSTVSINQSRSLFDDTTYNHSVKNTNEDNMKEKYFSDTLECKFVKINTVDSFIDLCLEQKQLLSDNEQANASSKYILPSKVCRTFRDLENAMHMRQKYDSEFQENYGTRVNAVETVHENLKVETVNKYSVLGENQNNINVVDARILTRLQDPIRIGRRIQYPKWHLSTSNISNSLNSEVTQLNNEIFHCVATDKNLSNVQLAYNSEHKNAINSKDVINSSLDHSESFNGTTQYNSTNKQIEKSVFLKPGKYWARSLSILNNIKDGSDLDKLSIGKGKKWRRSVKDILDMQKRGIFQSCLKKGKDDTDLPSDRFSTSNVSPFNNDRYKEYNLANYARFSKRISVRVVLNNTSTKCDIKDTSFLEAFGITEKSPNLKLSYREKSLIHHDRIISSHSTTARDVVLQKCSQNCYMSFADCFPDSYLEHCHKIGEGVYGEVFLYEYDGKKSVIKIIPIENEQLVNGEPQKKFSEILSEIVIAKELDDLKLKTTYKTNGFVEVKSISCIIGKYPEKLIELWNIYDNDKTSDNDCPSTFGENQLYIALELGHGGEDLEAFVFQTAEEAYALFLQIALALAIAEKALEFEHRDLHWGNVLVSKTKEPYIYYNLDGREIKFPSKGVKVSIIDFTLSRMLYQGCCIYNDLALDPALFTAHGEYQFEIYRLMRDKIQNNWRKFEPYTNVLWLHYILDKMITAVRYKKKNLKVHKNIIIRLQNFKDTILNYDSAYDFVINSNNVVYL